ncbi:DUF418 domain-containing protein [Corynebacterium hindlerae]|uniref:DUF418 domain-containing protein n=1 Tax=Corynebacterium hindlerae TaxID=699041 RepID=UPI0031B6B8A4
MSKHAMSNSLERATTSSGARRLMSLDVVRGVAVCGILFANVATIMGLHVPWHNAQPGSSYNFLHLVFQERFFPIFSLLFGVGFGILWQSVQKRSEHPRVVLLRRFLFLLLLGTVHQVLQTGEALFPYAIGGLVCLLPTTFLPERYRAPFSLGIGVLATAVGGMAGGMMLIPGLFWLGFGLALTDVPRKFDESTKPALMLLIGGLVVAIPGIALQLTHLDTAGFSPISAYAGLGQAAVYIALVGLAMHTPLRSGLVAFLAPLGRMALTAYVSATVVGVLIAIPFFAPLSAFLKSDPIRLTDAQMFMVWGGCVVFLIIQSLVARVWLAKFGQGPLEKLWRTVTWWGKR